MAFIGSTSSTEAPVWEEPVRGTFGDPSGLRLTGLTPTDAGYGSSTFAMPVTPWLQTTVPGLITGGILAFLADGPLGTAIMTVLPPLGYMTTSDLSMSFLRR